MCAPGFIHILEPFNFPTSYPGPFPLHSLLSSGCDRVDDGWRGCQKWFKELIGVWHRVKHFELFFFLLRSWKLISIIVCYRILSLVLGFCVEHDHLWWGFRHLNQQLRQFFFLMFWGGWYWWQTEKPLKIIKEANRMACVFSKWGCAHRIFHSSCRKRSSSVQSGLGIVVLLVGQAPYHLGAYLTSEEADGHCELTKTLLGCFIELRFQLILGTKFGKFWCWRYRWNELVELILNDFSCGMVLFPPLSLALSSSFLQRYDKFFSSNFILCPSLQIYVTNFLFSVVLNSGFY